jgi:hypothetical protein
MPPIKATAPVPKTFGIFGTIADSGIRRGGGTKIIQTIRLNIRFLLSLPRAKKYFNSSVFHC